MTFSLFPVFTLADKGAAANCDILVASGTIEVEAGLSRTFTEAVLLCPKLSVTFS
jgi:hypothetical protein